VACLIVGGRDKLDALEKRFTGKMSNASRETQAIVMPLIALVRSLDAELARYGSDNARLRAIEAVAHEIANCWGTDAPENVVRLRTALDAKAGP
jgi:hypothetical protein